MVRALVLFLIAIPVSAQTVRVQLTDGHTKWYEELPVTHRTADHTYLLTTFLSAAVTVADVENSIYALHKQGAVEANGIFGSHPSRGTYYAITIPVFAANAVFSYRYKRQDDALRAAGYPGHKYIKWPVPSLLNTIGHAIGLGVTVASTGR